MDVQYIIACEDTLIRPSECVANASQTYLTYITDNYENLPDVCVFTRSNETIDQNATPLQQQAVEKNGISAVSNIFEASPSDPTWGKHWNRNYNYIHYKDARFESFDTWYMKHIDPVFPDPIKIIQSGSFAVTKQRILSRSLDYYQRLLDTVSWHPNAIDHHFCERSWYAIFMNGEQKNDDASESSHADVSQ